MSKFSRNANSRANFSLYLFSTYCKRELSKKKSSQSALQIGHRYIYIYFFPSYCERYWYACSFDNVTTNFFFRNSRRFKLSSRSDESFEYGAPIFKNIQRCISSTIVNHIHVNVENITSLEKYIDTHSFLQFFSTTVTLLYFAR